MPKVIKNILLILVSIFAALLIAEGAARLVFDPIDFLKPVTASDEVLRYRIEPGSGAHDNWGFRNKSVPDEVDIVAIGDSHTYGVSAQAKDSWPVQLSGLTGKSVYNMSLPGYGPAEYFLLMQDKALGLRPDMIIAGFYLGNDLKDTFNAVYTVPVWQELRSPDIDSEISQDLLPVKKNGSPGLTDWLSSNSVLYRLYSSSFIGDSLRQRRRIARGERVVMLNEEQHGIKTGFTPDRRLKGLDIQNLEVSEGLMLSLDLFNRMNRLARENGIEFLVVIIPTKETVYSGLLEGNKNLPATDELDRLITSEREINSAAVRYFRQNGIDFIEVLPALQSRSITEQIYPSNFGGHTNKNGYRIIAETLSYKLGNKTRDQ